MPDKEWKTEKFVWDYLHGKGKKKRSCISVNKLKAKIENGDGHKTAQAWVVSIGWLFQQLVKCVQHDQETIRLAADAAGDLYIESFADAGEIDGSGAAPGIDPEGWNNDWPKISLP
jgi:hypothetical protein